MLMQLAAIWNYLIVILLMMIGLFLVISRANLVKKLVGLSIFQTSVFLFYITLGRVSGGTAPILTDAPDTLYSNPLPHVLILTAIVVGVATTMAVNIKTCGNGFEYRVSGAPVRIGAVPPDTRPSVI